MTAPLTAPAAVVLGTSPTPTGHHAANLLRSEWTKLRTVRSTYWTLFAAVFTTVAASAIVCTVIVAQYSGLSAEDKAELDPSSITLVGGTFAQLAIAVLGVLVITGEYSSGMIRTTFAAVPQRLTVLAAKAAVFGATTLAVMTATCFAAFFLGQAILSTKDVGVDLGAPNALRTVIGTILYLTILGLLALGLGTLIRKTAGGITAIVGLLFVLPGLSILLPSSLDDVQKFLPGNAGSVILAGNNELDSATNLSPWAGLGVFALYAIVALGAAAFSLVHRDA